MTATAISAMFPHAARRAGMYESFYLRAVAPDQPLGVWIRHTAHKRPGQKPRGSVWFTLFDASRGRPYMHKHSTDGLEVPPGGWIALGGAASRPSSDDGEGARMLPGSAQGSCGPARWSLRWSAHDPELRHLGRELLYRAPVPRTKLTSPAPRATFDGAIGLQGSDPIEVRRWQGLVGHNWGSEHAERWIWLHALDFAEEPEAWLDVALGRVRLAGALTPWIANGALCTRGRRYRVGGLGARGLRVAENVAGCTLQLAGERGLTLEARVRVPGATAAGWRYADPDGGERDVVNCSIAAVDLDVCLPGDGHDRVSLHSAHGGAYELGMCERDHGVPMAPFGDG